MTDTAPQIAYRNEYIAGFEQNTSDFRAAMTDEAIISGGQATFLVSDSGGAEAVTRGLDGKIPGRQDSRTQYTATLQEWHDKVERTNFNIFSSQGDAAMQRMYMQKSSIGVINRKIDDLAITELSTATNDTGTATTATLALFAKARAILGRNDVNIADTTNLFCAISPAAEAYLMQVPEFTSADYVEVKPFVGGSVIMRRWMGINFFMSNRLSGVGTNAEKLLMWHRSAIGYAFDKMGIEVEVDYNKEHAYSFARTTMHGGVKLLQNSGVVVLNHDGSGYEAA